MTVGGLAPMVTWAGAFNFFFLNNILYFYIYITNSINKHKKNVVWLVRSLKFKHEERGSNPPLFLPLGFFESHFGLIQKARPGPARGIIGRAAGLAF